MHPSRSEKSWTPRYNWIGVSVRDRSVGRVLEVDVYPRVWNDNQARFFPDNAECDPGEEYRRFTLNLGAWTPPPSTSPSSGALLEATAPPVVPCPSPTSNTVDSMRIQLKSNDRDAARALTYRFLDLPHITRLQIAQRLDLYTNDDEGIKDADLFERIFTRALRTNKLELLWEQVVSAR